MWGYLHRVPESRLSELLANPTLIEGELYPADDTERLANYTVEKTWNAIEFYKEAAKNGEGMLLHLG
jgi:hypothetical protein